MTLDIPEGDFAGYIFDLDGTLVDSMPLHYRAWDTALRHFGMPGRFDIDLFYSLGGTNAQRSTIAVGKHYGLEFDVDKVIAMKEALYVSFLTDIKLIEPVVAFARRVAKTHPVAIATGNFRDVTTATLKASKLDSIFEIVVTCDDVPPDRGKPHPDMFLLAAKLCGAAPEKCLVFEDAAPGIQAATAAGMTVVRVDSRA